MIKLNLPDIDSKLKKADGKVWIFDLIRKKYVLLTPEEWVRQHFLHYLIIHKQYPKSLIKVETGLTYNTLAKRSDIVVFDRAGKNWMVIECKSAGETISDRTIQQASVYNATLKASYVTITNGIRHSCFQVDHENKQTTWLDDLPDYPV